LFVSSKLGENADFHKTFKILYFADQKHLLEYGRPIIGDTYVKMTFGPVPSFIRNVVDGNIADYDNTVEVYNNHYIRPLREPNIDFLSETDLECLTDSIEENKGKTFSQLTTKSHDLAWNNATWVIDYEDMFKAVSEDANMLKYIQLNMLNNNLSM
jgi:uncharacterized phage-associated protein